MNKKIFKNAVILRRTVVLGYWLAPVKPRIWMLISVDSMSEDDTDSVLAIYEKNGKPNQPVEKTMFCQRLF